MMPRRLLSIVFGILTLILLGMLSVQSLREQRAEAQGGNGNLLGPTDLNYLGTFRVPFGRQGPAELARFGYGGTAPAFNPQDNSLFMVGHGDGQLVAEITIPEIRTSESLSDLSRATVLQNFADVTDGLKIAFQAEQREQTRIGGLLVDGDKLYGTVYIYYDGLGDADRSHFVSSLDLSNPSDVRGLYRVGEINPGYVAGYMAPVPLEWRETLGAPFVTGQGGIPIIGRSSLGPALFGFDPEEFGRKSPGPSDPVSAIPLVYYPQTHPTLGDYDDTVVAGDSLPSFNGAARLAGVVVPAGTRSVLFFGTQGIGEFCYGPGEECNDPADSSKGTHVRGGDYRAAVWAYDIEQLAEVKQGTREPWEALPYAVWNIDLPWVIKKGSTVIQGVAYDSATNRIFVVAHGDSDGYESYPLVHVLQVSADNPLPTLSITSPRAGETITDTTVTVSYIGSKGDDAAVDHSNFQLDQTPEVRGLPLVGSHTFQDVPAGQHVIRGYLAYADHGRVAGTDASVTFTLSAPPTNQPPSVSAGPDQTITLPASAALNGTVSDDGLPNPPALVTKTWSKVSGPGTVTFGDAAAEDTTASFSLEGTYQLRLTGNDSALSASDDAQVTVTAAQGPSVCFIIALKNRAREKLRDFGIATSVEIRKPDGAVALSAVATSEKDGTLRITGASIQNLSMGETYAVSMKPRSHQKRILRNVTNIKDGVCRLFPGSIVGDFNADGKIAIADIVQAIRHRQKKDDPDVSEATAGEPPSISFLVDLIRAALSKEGDDE